jgi:hypothetical protein
MNDTQPDESSHEYERNYSFGFYFSDDPRRNRVEIPRGYERNYSSDTPTYDTQPDKSSEDDEPNYSSDSYPPDNPRRNRAGFSRGYERNYSSDTHFFENAQNFVIHGGNFVHSTADHLLRERSAMILRLQYVQLGVLFA